MGLGYRYKASSVAIEHPSNKLLCELRLQLQHVCRREVFGERHAPSSLAEIYTDAQVLEGASDEHLHVL
jgi:hypothetical protein